MWEGEGKREGGGGGVWGKGRVGKQEGGGRGGGGGRVSPTG